MPRCVWPHGHKFALIMKMILVHTPNYCVSSLAIVKIIRMLVFLGANCTSDVIFCVSGSWRTENTGS